MIISHKHKFIFLKSRKTAGSSIQVTLSKYCGSDDIITGQYLDGVDDNSHSTGFNMDKFYTNHPHPEIIPTKLFIEQNMNPKIWNEYFKFAFVRNPYEIAVSRYFWERRGKGNVEACSVEDFRRWVKFDLLNKDYDWLHKYISINDNIELDYIGRYENLSEDYNYICDRLDLPKDKLPVKKGGYRDKEHYSYYYDDETKDIVSNFFKTDIRLFGYDFNSEFSVRRIKPIITRDMLSGDLGNNINGPSLIKVPDWIKNPLGKYYLYFAHHEGDHIRMAYSDSIEGGWKIYKDGTLKLNESECRDHIASPDVHIDEENKRIIMYYHGKVKTKDAIHNQCSFVSFSKNGLDFNSNSGILGMFYFRVFKYRNKFYAIAKNKNIGGILYESNNWDSKFNSIFEFIPNMRHCAILVDSDHLYIFYTAVGDAPESILMCKIKMDDDIDNWKVISNEIVLKPQLDYEGVDLPLVSSTHGSVDYPANQVRDPYVFKDKGSLYLLYSFAGESGIGLSKLYKIKE